MPQYVMPRALSQMCVLKSRSTSISSITQLTSERILLSTKQYSKRVSDVSRLCSCGVWIYKGGVDAVLSSDRSNPKKTCTPYDLVHTNRKSLHIGMGLTLNHNGFKSILRPANYASVLVQPSVRMFSIQSAAASIGHTIAEWYQALSESMVVSCAQDYFVFIHDFTGLPWWASIVLTTFTIRMMVLPLAVYHNYISAKRENVQAEVLALKDELLAETAYGIRKHNWSKEKAFVTYMRSKRLLLRDLYIRDNCHPMKAQLLQLVQVPTWICFSMAVRNLVYMLPESNTAAQLICLEMSVGGFGWIPNLTIPDSSLIIPVTLGLVNLATIEMYTMSNASSPNMLGKIINNGLRVMSIVMVAIAASVPSSLSLYWLTSSTFGLCQNLVLLSPKVKSALGIPKCASTRDQPYKHIADKIRERAAWLASPLSSK